MNDKAITALLTWIFRFVIDIVQIVILTLASIFCARHLFKIEWGNEFWVVFLLVLVFRMIFRPRTDIHINRGCDCHGKTKKI